jgi:zinc transporter ZupT
VFSLTFAEKIIDFHKASRRLKAVMFIAWGMFITSITFTGLAICFIALAGGYAAHHQTQYLDQATLAWLLLISAGAMFVLGLLTLVTAAGFSAFTPEREPHEKSSQEKPSLPQDGPPPSSARTGVHNS